MTKVKRKRVGRYSDAIRTEVASVYGVSGNISEVSRVTGVSRQSVMKWRDSGESWWDTAVDKARHQISDTILSQHLKSAQLSGEQLQDRIVNGDTKVLANGNTVSVPMTGRDLAVVNGIQTANARVSIGLATSRTERATSMDDLVHM